MRMRIDRSLPMVGLGLMLAIATAGRADAAKELKASAGVGQKHPVVAGGYVPYVEGVERDSKGAITFRTFYGGQLLGLNASLNGLRDGIADLSFLVLSYWPAQLPHGKLVADLALLGTDASVMAGAANEFIFNCPACTREFQGQGVVFHGTHSTTPYRLIGRGRISGLDDIKGKKLRSAGPAWNRWAESVGALPVSLPGDDTYEALNSGVINATIHPIANLRSMSLWDRADTLTMIPLGTYHASATFAYNTKIWSEFSPADRSILLKNAALAVAGTTAMYVRQDVELVEEAKSKGIKVIEPTDDLLRATHAFALKDLAVVEAEATKAGIADAKGKIAQFRALVEKWEKLAAGVQGDAAKLGELLRANVFSKVDSVSYGL